MPIKSGIAFVNDQNVAKIPWPRNAKNAYILFLEEVEITSSDIHAVENIPVYWVFRCPTVLEYPLNIRCFNKKD